jgi:16S rRNA (cytidine1402-2'-O)-methyltransferase
MRNSDSDVRETGTGGIPDATAPRFRAAARTLYVVATPLGNLRDVTLRALDVLATADVIAAEDTRVTTPLLRYFGIATRPLSLHQHNEAKRATEIVGLLREGKSVALVTDAGTPAISDPGARLVAAVRSAMLPVVPVPGPNAAVAAISAAGLEAERFVFTGFLPAAAKARRELLATLAPLPMAVVVYEAPHRVIRTVGELSAAFGGDRVVVVAREITKKFETFAAMRLADAATWLAAEDHRTRGEFVLVVDAPRNASARETEGASPLAVDRLLRALAEELPPARAARVAAVATGLPRDTLYERIRALKPGD